MSTVIEGDVHFSNNVTFAGQATLPNGSVTAGQIAAGAGIEATKLQQRNRAPFQFGESDTPAASKTFGIYTVTGATGTLRDFKVGAIVAALGNSTVTVDLLKNGASVLSAVVTLDSTQAARQLVTAAISSMVVAAGDVLEVVLTATAGTGTLPKGVFGYLTIDEAAQ